MELSQEMIKQITEAAVTAALAAQGATAQKATVGNTGTFNLIHGHGSMFGGVQVGIEPEVISTLMHWRGVGNILPVIPSPYIEVFLPFVTGVEETSSTEQATECGDCISGETEACIQHMPTARICRETQDMTITRIVDRLNRGDIDLQLLNKQMGDSPWTPNSPFSGNDLMQIATAWALLYELPPLFARKLTPMVYTGNPVNNVGQAYREFNGFDRLINTGFADAFTGTTCPGLDSDLKDFNYGDVTTQNSPSFYEMLEMAHYYVLHSALSQGLDPVEHVVVMRPELWQVFSQLIPVQRVQAALMTWLANSPGNMEITFNGTEIATERDRFRELGVVPLNGRMVKVVTDDGIYESNNANDAHCDPGEYASDVYIIPISYLGNRKATYIQHKDYRAINGEIAAADGMIDGYYRSSPDGRFAWAVVTNGPCFKIQAYTEPRIILRVPQLAARIQNVLYVPLQHLKSPDQDSPYWKKGGVSTRAPASYYFYNTRSQ